MWSLYRRKEEEVCNSGVGLFSYTGELLKPLKFSNGKTQEDVVKEILDEIKQGTKVIFVKGVCGSGKSAIALNLARYFNKTSIVVPIKSLQEQYERDYTREKFITKDDGSMLKIKVIKGRGNFNCPFLGGRADDVDLPCTIEIRDKNTEQLLKYIDMNPAVEKEYFSEASDIKRMNIAPACPYWAPIMPSNVNPHGLEGYSKKEYPAVCGKEFAIFKRKKGCGYYDQYDAYADADVLIFNSAKYLIETQIGRKPKTDLEIIDECDEFLDSFSNERRLNLNRLYNALLKLTPSDKEHRMKVKELLHMVDNLILNPPVIEIQKLRDSPILQLIEFILENPNLAEDEELNYYNNALEIARSFEGLLEETYTAVESIEKEGGQKDLFGNSKKEKTIIVSLVTINLAKKFNELVELNNAMVLMSGTIHSPEVLRDIFGLKDFKIIEAETQNPGRINKIRTGLEKNCSFASFKRGLIDRKKYLKIMDVCMANAEPPVLVHVSAFKDLPTEEENAKYKFENLITQEKLRELQSYGNQAIDNFSRGETEVLFTTKCSRGVDFPGDKCKSIVVTRFPYPNIQGLFWKILKKEQPEKFMEFYMDKAKRELIQKISRGVRFVGDKVDLLSPDIRVLNADLD